MKPAKYILISLALLSSLWGAAQEYHARHDSIWVYNSWESMMDQWPDTLIVNPEVNLYTPYDIDFDAFDDDANRMLETQTVALSLGDSLWLVNSRYLKKNFSGDIKKMDNYVPLLFNAKMAFIECVPSYTDFGTALLGSFFGMYVGDPFNDPPELYWINFENRKVEKVTHKNLPRIMEFYPDLQRRYEAMANRKDREVIKYFFYDFVRRAERDPSYPYLLDRLNEQP